MIRTHTDFIFRTNHTVRLNSAQFGAFDRKLLITIIQLRPRNCYDNFLSGSHIRGTADNLQRFATTYIDCSNM